MKVALFSPMPPERSGIADYSALLLPALRARCEVVVVKRGREEAAARHRPLRLPRRQQPRRARLDRRRAAPRRPGVVVLHDFVLHHLVAGLTIGRRDGHGYLDAMEREGGVVGRLLGHGVLDKRIPPLWENRPEDFPLAGEVLGLATGLIVHSRYVARPRACGRLRRADLGRPASRPSPFPTVARGRRRRRARSSAASATSTRASASRSCSRRSRALRRAHPSERAAPRRRRRRRASTSTAGSSASGSTATASSARATSTSAACGR